MQRFDLIVVDGYNLLHRSPEALERLESDPLSARQRLLRQVETVVPERADRMMVVFDGRSAGIDPAMTSERVEVRFAPGNLTADSVIERFVCAYANPERLLVATSDRAERDVVLGAGADVVSATEFLDWCATARNRAAASRRPPSAPPPRLGDFFPND